MDFCRKSKLEAALDMTPSRERGVWQMKAEKKMDVCIGAGCAKARGSLTPVLGSDDHQLMGFRQPPPPHSSANSEAPKNKKRGHRDPGQWSRRRQVAVVFSHSSVLAAKLGGFGFSLFNHKKNQKKSKRSL